MGEETIVKVFWNRVSAMPDRPAIMYKAGGSYRPVLWKDHGKNVEHVATGLMSLGVKVQDHVCIMSQSRPHWTWSDLGILSCGAVTVPIYPTLPGPEAQFLTNHSQSVGAIVENERQAKKLLESAEPLPNLSFIVVMEGAAPPVGSESGSAATKIRCLTWEELAKLGDEYAKEHPGELMRRVDNLKKKDVATIVYTSGTTGVPKGAMLLHSNIHSVCQSMSQLVKLNSDDLFLSFLPLSHVYERVGGQFLAIFEGMVVAFAESLETVPANLQEVRPTILNGVPRFYEKAYQRVQANVRTMPAPQQYLIRWALSLARRAKRYGKTHDDIIQKVLKGELRVADRLVFSKIRQRFGGRLRIMVSGAAPLSEEVADFFASIGLQMIEGYGLTETSAPVACNTPDNVRVGTVGQPLPGVELKIAEDGEIMVRGPAIFAGYYKNEEATKEAFQDGWFLTGDIGEIDADGYLKIKDRKKDIIITAGGKHVAPQYVENLFRGESLISNIVVFGDRRKYITALITLNKEGAVAFAKANGMAFNDADELVHHPRIKEEIEALVQRKNEGLASFERIKKFAILDSDFSAEANEITPTFKLKRKVITEKYKNILDGLYDAKDLELEDVQASK